MATMTQEQEKVRPGQILCPFLLPGNGGRIYTVEGFCQGLPNGLPMIPTVEEFRTRCSTTGYTTCPIYRSKMGQDGLAAWLRVEYGTWALHPLEARA